MSGHRRELLWIAALVHRVSGLLLALFLPLHFLTLGLALNREAELDTLLRWTDAPLLKLTEMVLVALLTVHLLGGLRLLWLENVPGARPHQKPLAAMAGAGAILIAGAFLLRAFG